MMNGNRASGLWKGYSGPSLHGSDATDQKCVAPKGDFRQASHTTEKKILLINICEYDTNLSKLILQNFP